MIPILTAKEARKLAKADVPPRMLAKQILLSCYSLIHNCAACGSTSVAADVTEIDEDQGLVAKALKKAARSLRKKGYTIEIQGATGFNIEWGDAK